MAKRRDSPYATGRRSPQPGSRSSTTATQEVVVGGWRPGNGRRADSVGALLLGIPDGDGLRYVGKVGTGFTDRSSTSSGNASAALARKTARSIGVPSADARGRALGAARPVGEVEFAEWTGAGRLRQPSWRGLASGQAARPGGARVLSEARAPSLALPRRSARCVAIRRK